MDGTRKPIPTLAEFTATVRDAFSFLRGFGFEEVPVPAHRDNAFELWFGADDGRVIVQGEGHGTMASVTLERDALELREIYLVPIASRPGRRKKGANPGQLEQIREAAHRLEQHGSDFLREGDLERFLKLARPLPSYKQPGA